MRTMQEILTDIDATLAELAEARQHFIHDGVCVECEEARVKINECQQKLGQLAQEFLPYEGMPVEPELVEEPAEQPGSNGEVPAVE